MTMFDDKSMFTAPVALFAALFALLAFFCLPALAADGGDAPTISSLAGSAKGENGLAVSWTLEKHVPGKDSSEDKDDYWLVVKPVLNGKELETLYLESYYGMLVGGPFVLVEVMDYNIDGHDDLRLTQGIADHGAYGPVYLYNPQTGKFEENETFSDLWVEKIDKSRRVLINRRFESACSQMRQEMLVKGFDQLELLLEEGSECPSDELAAKDEYRYFKRVYKDGKVVSEDTKIFKTDESWDSETQDN